jgi:SagB-type dehydrogenase family enzyme
MRNLTLRLDDGGVAASDDEGLTVRLPEDLASRLTDAFALACETQPTDQLSAATRAALAEARTAAPLVADATPPSWRASHDGERLRIGELVQHESRPLSDVLARRCSKRTWNPPTLASLATIVVRCTRVIQWIEAPDGYTSTHRPVASAGARHPFELYLLAGQVDGLAPGAWHFDALSCDLIATEMPCAQVLARLGEVVGADTPPAALVAVAHLDRTLSRYPAGLSLLWRDAGALLATLQLCASDIRLASCITGTCGVFVDDEDRRELDVGALLVGADSRV